MTVAVGDWRDSLARAARELGSPLEARRLVEEVSGLDLVGLVVAGGASPTGDQLDRLAELVERRRSGEPLQHVLGHWSFRTLELAVDSRALVPRPETEIVAGCALGELARRRAQRALVAGRDAGAGAVDGEMLLAIDLGTGSGAIACALVAEAPDVRVVAVDASPEALDLARANRDALGEPAGRLELVEGHWYTALSPSSVSRVDCVVANPPYLSEAEWPELDPVVRDHDPYAALVAGPSGLEAIEEVVAGAASVLAPDGSLVVEIAPSQAVPVEELARQAGMEHVSIVRDLAGRERVLVARWPGRTRDVSC